MSLARRLPALLPATCLLAAPPAAQPPLSPAQHATYLAAFEQVWSTVAARHWDPKLGGLDWQKVHDELKPAMERARTAEAARAVLQDMLARLKQTHFAIIPAEAYADLQEGRKGDCGPGLELRPLGGRVIITRLDPDGPAAKAGLKPGMELLSVDGTELAPVLSTIDKALAGSTLGELVASRRLTGMLDGAEGSQAELRVRDQPAPLRVERKPPRGKIVRFGEMPAENVWTECRSLPGGVRYLRFNIWLDPESVAGAFQESLKDASDCKGFIIDLRGNPGGIGGMAMGAAGWFTEGEGRKLGTMIMRDASLKFVVFPRPSAFKGPLAILVDGCSASTSEIFAGGMQDLKRARIFGTRTAGAALPSVFERLPSGDGFQFAIANYISEGGLPLEGRGVNPDEEVRLDPKDLLAGKDTVIERALAWIQGPTR